MRKEFPSTRPCKRTRTSLHRFALGDLLVVEFLSEHAFFEQHLDLTDAPGDLVNLVLAATRALVPATVFVVITELVEGVGEGRLRATRLGGGS